MKTVEQYLQEAKKTLGNQGLFITEMQTINVALIAAICDLIKCFEGKRIRKKLIVGLDERDLK